MHERDAPCLRHPFHQANMLMTGLHQPALTNSIKITLCPRHIVNCQVLFARRRLKQRQRDLLAQEPGFRAEGVTALATAVYRLLRL